MRIALDSLPTDAALLQQLVRDMAAALDEGQVEIDRLRLIIKQFQRAQFGRSAERLDPDQVSFGLEELEADLARAKARRAASMPPAPADPFPAPLPRPPHRTPLPPHLPRIENRHFGTAR